MDYMIQSKLSRLGSLITCPKFASQFYLLSLSGALHTFHTFSLSRHLPPLLSSAFISNLISSESLHLTSSSVFRSTYIRGSLFSILLTFNSFQLPCISTAFPLYFMLACHYTMPYGIIICGYICFSHRL